mgnify:FL=1
MSNVVVLLSGGQDSTTCLYWAKQHLLDAGCKPPRIHALTLSYGQRHKAEIAAARKIAGIANCVSHEVMQVDALIGAKSALTDGSDIAASGGLADREAPDGLPTTFVPGRNLVFLALAAAHAARCDADYIVTGVCQTDYSGYPDCRLEFIHAMQGAINAAWPSGKPAPRILVPLMHMTKAETVAMSNAFPGCHEALAWSVTCYNGLRPGCGTCPACDLRVKGFREANVTDPAEYNGGV